MREEIKFDLDEDIMMQIEMDSYMKYNDTIASMNDHLGEIYGYSDVRDTEEAKLKYEKELAYKAIVQLQQKVEQLEERCEYLERSNNRREDEIISLRDENVDLVSKNKQLENIRKEAIEYVYKHIQEYDADGTFTNLDEFDFIASPQVLLDILNKGGIINEV